MGDSEKTSIDERYTYGENGAGPHAVTSLSDGCFLVMILVHIAT
jgi:hypothetical protein